MRKIREWFDKDPNRIIVAMLLGLVLLGYCSKPRAAQLQPVQCIGMGVLVADVVVMREIGGDVEKHLALLRRLNPEIANEIHDAVALFVRRGYADRKRTPEEFGNDATDDCMKRKGHYAAKQRL